jgi:hypothetical protein
MASDSFLATTMQIMFRLVELHGLDARQFIRDLGDDPAHFRDPRARLPSRFADRAIQKAATLFAAPAFGLCAAPNAGIPRIWACWAAVQHLFCKKSLSDFSGYGLTRFEIQVDFSSHPILITLGEQG